MSRASKLTLGATSLFAVGTVVFVHFQQKMEQNVCLLLLSEPLSEVKYTQVLTLEPPGNASRRSTRHGATARQSRTTTRLRPPETARSRIQTRAECAEYDRNDRQRTGGTASVARARHDELDYERTDYEREVKGERAMDMQDTLRSI